MMEQAGLPPRIDATPEEIVRATLRRPVRAVEGRVYRCVRCEQAVEWPVVLGGDGVCEGCVELGSEGET